MVTSIQTENFKALANIEVDFISGLNILKGPNGVGKSSLIHAIKFALYGATAVPGKKSNIPTWGKKKAEVIVNMEDGHEIYRTTTDCSISLDGVEVAVGNSPCSAYIADHFALDLKGFEMFHCSNQGETAALLTLGATELQRRVEKYAEVSVIDDTVARARKGAIRLSGLMEVYEIMDKAQLKELRKSVKAMAEELKLAGDVVTTTRNLKMQARTDKTSAKEELQEARNQNDRAEKLGKRRDRLTSEVTASERELKAVRDELRGCEVITNLEELEALIETLDKSITANTKANQKITDAKEQEAEAVKQLEDLPELEKDLEKWELQLGNIEDEQELCQKEVEMAAETLVTAKADKTQKVVELAAAKEALDNAVCVTCKRPFEDHDIDSAKAHIEEKSAQLDSAMATQKEANEAHTERLSEAEVTQDELDAWERQNPENDVIKLRSLQEELEEIQELAAIPLIDIDTQKVELKKTEAEVTLATANKRTHTRLTKRDTELSEEIDELETKLENLEEIESVNLAAIEALVDAATEACIDAIESEGEAVIAFNTSGDVHSKLNEQLTKVEESIEKMAELSKEYSLTNKLVDYLVKSRERFMSEVWDTILGNASHFCSIATKDWTAPDGRSKQIPEITRKDGAFFFSEGGITQPIESASGAQRAFMGVGVRLGMSIALKGSHSLLILDEPAADMANDNANALAGSLLSLPGQVIMITHRPYEELSANNVIDLGA